ncbi:MAG: hypothetical protein JXA25_05695 [Anaerolineales bacterium]|nr:hypothetical protein [Anaerolineales bacterium]
MMSESVKLDLMEKLAEVKHPEIACTLEKLGMIHDVTLAPSAEEAQLTLALPVLGIPAVVKDILIQSLTEAADTAGVSLEVQTVQMTTQERENFLTLARTHWRDKGTDVVPCG